MELESAMKKRQRPSTFRVKKLEEELLKATTRAEKAENNSLYWRRMAMRAARLLTAPQGGQSDCQPFLNELLQELMNDMPQVYRAQLGEWMGMKWIDTNFNKVKK